MHALTLWGLAGSPLLESGAFSRLVPCLFGDQPDHARFLGNELMATAMDVIRAHLKISLFLFLLDVLKFYPKQELMSQLAKEPDGRSKGCRRVAATNMRDQIGEVFFLRV